MTRFLDGPAAGEVMSLRRDPRFLRVVRSAVKGEWDALDQLADTPRPRESIWVYRRVGGSSWIFVRPGGRFACAEYILVADQPGPDVVRDTARWRAWATEQTAAAEAAGAP